MIYLTKHNDKKVSTLKSLTPIHTITINDLNRISDKQMCHDLTLADF